MSTNMLVDVREIPAMPNARKSRTKTRQSQSERRERSDRAMLKAAVGLIAEKGLASISLAEVGITAGYSRGLVVERYGSKAGMVLALLDSMEQWFENRLQSALEGRIGMQRLYARIATHLHGVRVSAARVGALYAIHAEVLRGMPEVAERVMQQESHWRDGFRSDLNSAIENGEAVAGIDTQRCARLLFAAQRGLLHDFIASPNSQFLENAERTLVLLAEAAASGRLESA